jgi:hypothetical protein
MLEITDTGTLETEGPGKGSDAPESGGPRTGLDSLIKASVQGNNR